MMDTIMEAFNRDELQQQIEKNSGVGSSRSDGMLGCSGYKISTPCQ